MNPQYRELFERRFLCGLPASGPDKRMPLKEAIAAHIRPGQKLYMAHTNSRPYGLMHELIRQYWKQDPQFEVALLSRLVMIAADCAT